MTHGPAAGGRRFGRELRTGRLALAMNVPTLIGLVLILAYPIFYAGYLSFHKVSIRELRTGIYPFVGLENYARLFGDGLFWLSLGHTFAFVAATVVLEVVIGLAIALVISDRRILLAKVTRVLVLVPWAVPPVVNGLLWGFIFNTQYGYLNRVLHGLGLIDEYVNWLGSSNFALMAVVIAYVWRTTPFNILLYDAALQGIPRHLYEAAEIDGANAWQVFWRITLPLLRPVLAVTLILRTTFAFMVFDEILAITNGGPGNDTWVAAWYTYKMSFQPPFNIGLGAASAYVMALVVGVIALIYVRAVYRRVEY